MPKYSRGVMRLLGVLALAVVLSPAVYTVASGSAGRDFSRCVHTCNDAKAACNNRCSEDCFALYPNSKPQRDACIAACKTNCTTQSEDCKLVCQAIKNGECPSEP